MNHDIGNCPCGMGIDYTQCCGRYIEAGDLPEYPEQLMRSRYTAFVLHRNNYLRQTWHESTRPEQLHIEQGLNWLGLQIINCQDSALDNDEGWVEFIATYSRNGHLESLRERSRFIREDKCWLYVDDQIFRSPVVEKISRNLPCPCGSGKKYKCCCADLF